MEFIYSRHSSYDRAEIALEAMYASGEVFPSEFKCIRRMKWTENGRTKVYYAIILKDA